MRGEPPPTPPAWLDPDFPLELVIGAFHEYVRLAPPLRGASRRSAEQGRSPETIRLYCEVIALAETWCRDQAHTLTTIPAERIVQWLAARPDARRAQMRIALRHFWRMVGRTDPLPAAGNRERPVRVPGGGPEAVLPDGRRVSVGGAMVARGYAANTIRCYRDWQWRLIRWCREHGTTLEELDTVGLIEFLAEVPLGRESRMHLRRALQLFWEIAERPDPPDVRKVVRLPTKRRMRSKALPDVQARQLEAAARRQGGEAGLAVLCGLYLALRVHEIAKLRWDELDLEEATARFIGKGNVEAELPIHPVLKTALSEHPRRSEWVFPGRFGGPVVPATVWGWVRALSERAGLGQVATHVLRHTALTTANDATGDLRSVQEFARHADPEMTAGYTRANLERIRRVVSSLDYGAPVREPDPLPFDFVLQGMGVGCALGHWRQLAALLQRRPGWYAHLSEDGTMALTWQFGPGLWADVTSPLGGNAPRFSLARAIDDEDVVWWYFNTEPELAAALTEFELHEGLIREPDGATFDTGEARAL